MVAESAERQSPHQELPTGTGKARAADAGRIALGLIGARLGVGDLAGGVLPAGADIAVGALAGLADLFGSAVADAAYLLLCVSQALAILRPCG
jgi:hypothetical protein